jgi:hypothetical protein
MSLIITDSERDMLLDRILTNLGTWTQVRKELFRDIKRCFPFNLFDENHIYFDGKRSKSVIHFIVRKLLRFRLDCAESCRKYYGNDPATETKLEKLLDAARSFQVFDEYPPDILSTNHPTFTKSTPEGLHASKLYGTLEALRVSVTRKIKIKKIAEVSITTDQVSRSSSSNSDQPSSVVGKRTSSMESSPTATTSASFMESPPPGSSKISPIQSLIKAGTSFGTSTLTSISGVFGANVDEKKDSTLLSGRDKENLDIDNSVEFPTGDNVR